MKVYAEPADQIFRPLCLELIIESEQELDIILTLVRVMKDAHKASGTLENSDIDFDKLRDMGESINDSLDHLIDELRPKPGRKTKKP